MSQEYTHSLPFEAYEPTGGQVLSSGPVTVTFGAIRLLDSARFAFHGDSEIEVLTPGAISVTARVGVQQTGGNSRNITEIYLEMQPAGGSYAVVPGSRDFVYTRNSNDGAYGSVRSEATIQVAEGDRVRVRGTRFDGSGGLAVVEGATSLHAEFVAY